MLSLFSGFTSKLGMDNPYAPPSRVKTSENKPKNSFQRELEDKMREMKKYNKDPESGSEAELNSDDGMYFFLNIRQIISGIRYRPDGLLCNVHTQVMFSCFSFCLSIYNP